MPNLNAAYQWAIATCNNPNVGYSQSLRNQVTRNGITYYDCSSFIWYALLAGGFDCVSANGGNTWPMTTENEPRVLKNLGFIELPIGNEWRNGDVVWRRSSGSGHTEMVYDGSQRKTMGAHSSGRPLGEQVSINSNPSSPSSYMKLFRYPEGTTTNEWIDGDKYLSHGEQINNATIIYNYYMTEGWSLNAIAGLMGNIQRESTFCPDLNERGSGTGYGLVQWTPKTNYTNYASQQGWDLRDYDKELLFISEDPIHQWIGRVEPLDYEAFKHSMESPEDLAEVFCKNYERAGVEAMEERRANARYWYDYFLGQPVVPPNAPWEPEGRATSGLPIFFYKTTRRR